jgi:hypothetical protein
MIGGGGSDQIDVAGGGVDTATGGPGADRFKGRRQRHDHRLRRRRPTPSRSSRACRHPPPPPGPVTLGRDGELKIKGTDAADTLAVTLTGGNIVVTLNALTAIQLPATSVRSIKAEMGAGDDVVTIDAAITLPANVNGGTGNDKIKTGGGNDKVDGGRGNDTIDTGAGMDKIHDEAGINTVTGGPGADTFEVNDTTTITDFDPAVDTKKTEDDEDDDGDATAASACTTAAQDRGHGRQRRREGCRLGDGCDEAVGRLQRRGADPLPAGDGPLDQGRAGRRRRQDRARGDADQARAARRRRRQ